MLETIEKPKHLEDEERKREIIDRADYIVSKIMDRAIKNKSLEDDSGYLKLAEHGAKLHRKYPDSTHQVHLYHILVRDKIDPQAKFKYLDFKDPDYSIAQFLNRLAIEENL